MSSSSNDGAVAEASGASGAGVSGSSNSSDNNGGSPYATRLREKFPPKESPIYWLFNKTDKRAFCFSSRICLEGNYLDSRGSASGQLFIYVQLFRRLIFLHFHLSFFSSHEIHLLVLKNVVKLLVQLRTNIDAAVLLLYCCSSQQF